MTGEAPFGNIINFFGSSHSFYRFDQRGNGFSDWEPQNISFDNFVDDLEAVVNDVGLENYLLYLKEQLFL